MANIPNGYKGTYGKSADGKPVLVVATRTVDEKQPHVTYTKEQKQEYAKQFTPSEIKSYRNGQRSAYAHMGNIGKRNSFFIFDNMTKDGAPTPQGQKPTAAKPTKPKK